MRLFYARKTPRSLQELNLHRTNAGVSNSVLQICQPRNTLLLMKTISVKLPEPVANWLVRQAKATKRTRSAIVREALERERSGKDRPNSCRDLLADLEGFFDGPPDLSTNPKHMEGFGQ